MPKKKNNIIPLEQKPATALKLTPPAPQLPEIGYLRLSQIVGDKKKGIPPILPIGKSTFLLRVKNGEYPQPDRLSKMTVAWKVEDIRALVASFGGA